MTSNWIEQLGVGDRVMVRRSTIGRDYDVETRVIKVTPKRVTVGD